MFANSELTKIVEMGVFCDNGNRKYSCNTNIIIELAI